METGFGFKFYNAGKRISELFRFSTTDSSAGQAEKGDGTSFWALEAPEKGWFFVPTEISAGTETIRVNFAEDIKRKFGHMGVVLLDPRYNRAEEDPDKELQGYAIAASEAGVIERAEEIWKLYLRSVVDNHMADCDQALSAGGRPRKASGFTRYALKVLAVDDPGQQLLNSNTQGVTGDVAAVLSAMQAQQSATNAILIALASGQKLDADMLKALSAPVAIGTPGARRIDTPPVRSGEERETMEVDGQQAVGVEARIQRRNDGWEKGEGNRDKGTLSLRNDARPKKERAAEAAKAL